MLHGYEAEIGQIFPTFSVTLDNVIPELHPGIDAAHSSKNCEIFQVYQNTVSNSYPQ
jgi:hypothetical protein